MLNTFLIAMFLTVLILLITARLATVKLIRQHHGQKIDFFHQFQPNKNDIVFLGDSLTDGARWEELFPDYPVLNRGINADTTEGVFHRLEDITQGKPKAIFLLIGTNDLPWYEYHSDSEILNWYEQIVTKILQDSPDTKLFIQSLLPRRASYASRIKRINLLLAEIAAKHGVTYIDLFPKFVDVAGGLRNDLTNDRLHLLAKGYQIWAQMLQPYIDKLQ